MKRHNVDSRKRDREPSNIVLHFKGPMGEGVCTELCTGEARRGTVCWKIGVWRPKRVGEEMYRGFVPHM
jgi:hypothetical protein